MSKKKIKIKRRNDFWSQIYNLTNLENYKEQNGMKLAFRLGFSKTIHCVDTLQFMWSDGNS